MAKQAAKSNARPNQQTVKIRSIPAIILAGAAICIAEPIRFIPATPDNTTFEDGTAFAEMENGWKWLPGEGNQGIFESAGDPAKNAPILIIHAKGLEPGRDYEVFGFFWAHGFGAEPATRGKQPHHWPARFGTGLASLATFGGRISQDIPWIICPESKTGVRTGYPVFLEEKNPMIKDVPGWITAAEDTRLIRARAGISRADENGVIQVYADDYTRSKFTGLTRIDGIGLRLLATGVYDGTGSGKAGYLQLAVRAGNKLNMRRELAAGADVNALDEDGVTPLLYPATFGDQDTVRELLKAGANPNQPGQSISPLTGAASWGDTEMVKLLLDAGATVPDKLSEPSPLLNPSLNPARLHPAIAAIRAGSLGSLKWILSKKPDLDLTKLVPDIDATKRRSDWKSPDEMVKDAIGLAHDDLAAFLIERGCKVNDQMLLVQTVRYGDRMAKTREALIARGVPAIQPRPYEDYVESWDALSAAVATGNVDLTKRFLPLAKNVDIRYIGGLYELADTCGVPDVLKAIQIRFPKRPKVEPNNYNEIHSPENDDTARLFLPRVGAGKASGKPSDSTWNLAVVAAPDAAGAASLIEVRAANGKQWQVVDRTLIEAAMKEDRHAKPWKKGEHRLAELGDRITADIILIVTKLGSKDVQLIRSEAVDVLSGLVIHREYAEEKSMGSGKAEDQLLAGINSAMIRARTNKRSLAMSLLTFTASKEVPSSSFLARQFRAAMEIEVDSTPGLLSVGMNEINMIAQEQNLRGEGSFWAAACTLEGGIASLPDGRLSLTLRLRNLTGNNEKPTDAVVEGTPQEIPALATRAWQKLIESGALPAEAAKKDKPDPKQTALEAARLTREADWLVNCGRPKEAKPLAERSSMLGTDSETIVPIYITCLFDTLPFRALGYSSTGSSFGMNVFKTLPLHYHRNLIDRLDTFCEVLEKTEALYHQHGRDSLKWKNQPRIFWDAIRMLCYSRTAIPQHLLTPEQADKFDAFCTGLDRFTSAYMEDLAQAYRERHPSIDYLGLGGATVSHNMLKQNPELLAGMAATFVASLDSNDIAFRAMFTREYNADAEMIASMDIMMSEISKHRGNLPPAMLRNLELQMQLNRSDGDSTPLLKRNCQLEMLESISKSRFSWPCRLPSQYDDNIYGLRYFFRIWVDGLPAHRDVILPSLLHEPAARPECLVRSGYFIFDSDQAPLFYMDDLSDRKAFRDSKRNSLISSAKNKLSNSLGNDPLIEQTSRRVDAMICTDLMYGLEVSEPISMEWKKLSGKLPGKATIRPSLLADLRRDPKSATGMFDLPTPDAAVQNRLWLRYRPYEDSLCHADGQIYSGFTAKEIEAWLVAVNCETSKIDQRISLSTFSELEADRQQDLSMQASGRSFIAQNSTSLLSYVGWGDDSDQRGAYALIDKSTGKPITLIKGIEIKEFNGYPQHQSVCVEVIDENFYMLVERLGAPFGVRNELLRIDPKGNQTFLTKFGRKPELTPCDSEDKPPTSIVKFNQSLLLSDDRYNYLVRYEPKADKWENVKAGSANIRTDLAEYMRKAFQINTARSRAVELPDGKTRLEIKYDVGVMPGEKVFLPGVLSVSAPGRKNAEIPLDFVFPDGYRENARFIETGVLKNQDKEPVQPSTVKQMQEQKRLHPVIIHQTDALLVIGLRIKPLKSNPMQENEAFLPFLWSVPKGNLFDHLGILQTGTKR